MTMRLPPFRVNPESEWRGADIGDKSAITIMLDPSLLAPIVEQARDLSAAGRDATDLTAGDITLGKLAPEIDAIATEILHGRGVVILAGFPVEEISPEDSAIVFWAIGLRLGTPVSQSVMGDRLGHITDVSGRDPNARAYRNANELTPHTDPADILAFLCLQPAKSGGVSRFVSSMTIHEELRSRYPEHLQPLYRGFRYHRFGEQGEEFPPITPHRIPVFSSSDGMLSCRYLRQYIEIAADEDPEITLTAAETAALDAFEALAGEAELCLDFTLEPGEAILANNFTVLHARTAFDDHDEPALKRHLLRLWISAHDARPIVPEVMMYEGEPGIPPQPGRTPSYNHNITIN